MTYTRLNRTDPGRGEISLTAGEVANVDKAVFDQDARITVLEAALVTLAARVTVLEEA
jgi:hypothetical protein